MRKFSLISESKINDKEIESILYDSGFEYLILHDYYIEDLDNIRDWVNGNGFYIELEQNKFASIDYSFIIKLIDF